MGQYNAINYSVEEGLPSSETYFVHQDHDGYIWICTDRGLSRYDGYEFKTYSTADGLTHNVVFIAYEDNNHDIWFLCYDGSITIYDFESKKLIPFWANDKIKPILNHREWFKAVGFGEDKIDLFITRSQSNISDERISINRKDSTILVHKIEQEEILNYDNITIKINTNECLGFIQVCLCHKTSPVLKDSSCVFKNQRDFRKSNEKNLYWDPNKIIVDSDIENTEISIDGRVSNALIDKDDVLWVTTTKNGLYAFPSLDVEILNLSKGSRIKNTVDIIGPQIDDIIFKLGNGELIQYNPISNTSKVLYTNSSLPDYQVVFYEEYLSIIGVNDRSKINMIDENGQSQFIQVKKLKGRVAKIGLFRIQNDGANLLVYDNHINYCFSIGNKYKVKSVSHLSDSLYVFATFDKIFKVRKGEKEIDITDNFGSANVKFNKLLTSKGDAILVSTYSQGFFYYIDGQSYNLNSSNGLSSNTINDFVVDENDVVWLATDAGISRVEYSPSKDFPFTFFNYSQNHGLPNKYIKQILNHKGYIYGAAQNGAFRFRSDNGVHSENKPSVFIKQINNQPSLGKTLSFKSDSNNVKIDYIGLTPFKNKNQTTYQYKLIKDGVLLNLVNTNSTSADFTNLSAGRYTFLLSAKTENGEWIKPKSVVFIIKKHWTDFLSVRILGLLFIGGLIYNLVRREFVKNKNIYQQGLVVEKLEHQLVEMELDLLRGQMNPHFVFNSLNSVQNHLLKGDAKSANKLIKRLANLLRSGLEYSKLDYIEYDQEVEFLKNYLDIELERFPNRFEYQINQSDDVVDFLIPPLLIQPICENAIKHSYNGQLVEINIDVEKPNKNCVLVKVSDNGIGYQNSKQNKDNKMTSLGLTILKKRIELFNSQGFQASYAISSLDKVNKTGTVVNLMIPIRD